MGGGEEGVVGEEETAEDEEGDEEGFHVARRVAEVERRRGGKVVERGEGCGRFGERWGDWGR